MRTPPHQNRARIAGLPRGRGWVGLLVGLLALLSSLTTTPALGVKAQGLTTAVVGGPVSLMVSLRFPASEADLVGADHPEPSSAASNRRPPAPSLSPLGNLAGRSLGQHPLRHSWLRASSAGLSLFPARPGAAHPRAPPARYGG